MTTYKIVIIDDRSSTAEVLSDTHNEEAHALRVVSGTQGIEHSWTEKFTNVANGVSIVIRSNAEMGGGINALKAITIRARVHTAKTPADYDDTYFIIYSNGSEICRISQINNWTLAYSSDSLAFAGGGLTFEAFHLGNPGADSVDIDLIYKHAT